MSRIQSKDQLLKEISCLIDEYIQFTLHSHEEVEYKMMVVDEKQTPEPKAEPKKKTKVVVADTQCRAILRNKKRCSREVTTETDCRDSELCKFHNNSKFEGKINKIEPPTTVGEESEAEEEAETEAEESKGSVEENDNTGSAETADDLVTVYLTKDDDDDMIDQDGNIWDMEQRIISGKKDLETNEKVFFKTI